MANSQSTQTRPQFQYRFFALYRFDVQAKPYRLSVVAYSEREARQSLVQNFILSFACRLPAGGNHA